MATVSFGTVDSQVKTLSTAAGDLEKAQKSLMDAYGKGADAQTLQKLSVEFQDKFSRFQAIQNIWDAINKAKDAIIQKLGQIGR